MATDIYPAIRAQVEALEAAAEQRGLWSATKDDRFKGYGEAEAAAIAALNRRVEALMMAATERALVRKLPLIAPRSTIDRLAAQAEADAQAIVAALLNEEPAEGEIDVYGAVVGALMKRYGVPFYKPEEGT